MFSKRNVLLSKLSICFSLLQVFYPYFSLHMCSYPTTSAHLVTFSRETFPANQVDFPGVPGVPGVPVPAQAIGGPWDRLHVPQRWRWPDVVAAEPRHVFSRNRLALHLTSPSAKKYILEGGVQGGKKYLSRSLILASPGEKNTKKKVRGGGLFLPLPPPP